MRYRAKPVEIEARQWHGTAEQAGPIINWVLENGQTARYDCVGECTPGSKHVIGIVTLEGTMSAQPGDYIIRGTAGEFYPCRADIFEAKYEPAGGA